MPINDSDLTQRLNYKLQELEDVRSKYAMRLALLGDCSNTILRMTMHGRNRPCYYAKRPGTSYHYVKKEKHDEVNRIKEARFLKEAIRRIDIDIGLIKSLDDGFLPFDMRSVSESLPKAYRLQIPPVSKMYKEASDKWLAERLAYQKLIPENYPQSKKHTTSDGVKVKTLSEFALYEMFKSAGLTQIYELPFAPADYGPNMYPDFTILSPIDLKSEIIVEFAGMMDKYNYREDFAKRVGRYIDSGYIPGVNLFFVFGGRDGSIDSLQVNKIIADIKGIRNDLIVS